MQSDIPYVLPDGNDTIVALDWSDLTDGVIAHPIDINESGQFVDHEQVWTGTSISGGPGGLQCVNWTSNSSSDLGSRGWTHFTNLGWTSALSNFCNLAARLFCFEQ